MGNKRLLRSTFKSGKSYLGLILGFGLGIASAAAQSSTSSLLNTSTTFASDPSQIKTEVRLFSDSFVSPAFEATQKTSYQFVGAEIKSDELSRDKLKVDVAAGVAVGAPLLNYINASEFYFEYSYKESEKFYIGRKKVNWNELDAHWDLGVWEPLFKWNPLAPERQGLTGLYWELERPRYSLLLYASPLFIPDQGPSFEIENGSFVKGNPWFRRPPETIKIFDEQTDIVYKFERPSESEVVLHSSFGGRLAFGDPDALRLQLSYIYKPSNQLAVGYDGYLQVDTGHVELLPEVFYHSLMGADLTYKIAKLRMGVSVLHDRPNKEEIFEERWTYQQFADANINEPALSETANSLRISGKRGPLILSLRPRQKRLRYEMMM